MKKKLLFLLVLGGLLSVPVLGQAVTSSSGGGKVDWIKEVGEPEDDPYAPSSFGGSDGLYDTQKPSASSGTQGSSKGESDPDKD